MRYTLEEARKVYEILQDVSRADILAEARTKLPNIGDDAEIWVDDDRIVVERKAA